MSFLDFNFRLGLLLTKVLMLNSVELNSTLTNTKSNTFTATVSAVTINSSFDSRKSSTSSTSTTAPAIDSETETVSESDVSVHGTQTSDGKIQKPDNSTEVRRRRALSPASICNRETVGFLTFNALASLFVYYGNSIWTNGVNHLNPVQAVSITNAIEDSDRHPLNIANGTDISRRKFLEPGPGVTTPPRRLQSSDYSSVSTNTVTSIENFNQDLQRFERGAGFMLNLTEDVLGQVAEFPGSILHTFNSMNVYLKAYIALAYTFAIVFCCKLICCDIFWHEDFQAGVMEWTENKVERIKNCCGICHRIERIKNCCGLCHRRSSTSMTRRGRRNSTKSNTKSTKLKLKSESNLKKTNLKKSADRDLPLDMADPLLGSGPNKLSKSTSTTTTVTAASDESTKVNENLRCSESELDEIC